VIDTIQYNTFHGLLKRERSTVCSSSRRSWWGGVVAVPVLLLLFTLLWVCSCVSRRRVASKAAVTCAFLFAPLPHTTCSSHISSSYFHGPSIEPFQGIRLHDISATIPGTYHLSAFMTLATTAVVGSRYVYAYDRYPICVAKPDFLTYHTSTAHPTKNFPSFFGFLESQQHLPCWPWRTD
jgi:hypothetical protein